MAGLGNTKAKQVGLLGPNQETT